MESNWFCGLTVIFHDNIMSLLDDRFQTYSTTVQRGHAGGHERVSAHKSSGVTPVHAQRRLSASTRKEHRTKQCDETIDSIQ